MINLSVTGATGYVGATLVNRLALPLAGEAAIADYFSLADHAIVAIGNIAVCEKLMQQLTEAGHAIATVVHLIVFVTPTALEGQGSTIMGGAIVGTEARLGVNGIVICGAVVDRHSIVEDFGHLGVNSSMARGTLPGRSA